MQIKDYFGEMVADHYDESAPEMFDPESIEPCVSLLEEIAGTGSALELGIGTGRIAIPLSERGISVYGIDLSSAMINRLRQKKRGRDIPVTMGNFATTKIEGSFSLVYLVFNTIMNLTTQAAQVACFHNAASHLSAGGSFVVEVMVPDLQRLPFGQTIRPSEIKPTKWGFMIRVNHKER